jgi:orotidine-5'-phosphate decarboxylase
MSKAARVPKLIVALDVASLDAALALVEQLHALGVGFKIGHEALFGYGDAIRERLERRGSAVFVDAKLHDIPRTVAAGVRAIVRPGVEIISIHALGGNDMMIAAVDAAAARAAELGIPPPGIFAVTVLTSIAPEELNELGFQGGPGENAMRLAALARDARCNGIICSSHEVHDLKAFFGSDLLTLCAGIRPAGIAHGDQKRVATPRAAVEGGADYLVVGRPITEAADPAEAARAILEEMAAALADGL